MFLNKGFTPKRMEDKENLKVFVLKWNYNFRLFPHFIAICVERRRENDRLNTVSLSPYSVRFIDKDRQLR